MKKEDEFYIGYLDKAPKGIRQFIRTKVRVISLIIILASLGFALGQKQFSNSSFELGKLTRVEGVFYNDPYPMLKVTNRSGQFKNVLLLGFGKFGADKNVQQIADLTNQTLEGKRISLEGTLIYYNGKTLMQLENDVSNTIEGKGGSISPARIKRDLGKVQLKGEIIDPKCYFGVMKPGLGKIHRSCAVRCISGGIPPVFVTTNQNGDSNYFLITDEKGDRLKDELLPYVGKGVQINAQLSQLEDWNMVKLNPVSGIQEIQKYSDIYIQQ